MSRVTGVVAIALVLTALLPAVAHEAQAALPYFLWLLALAVIWQLARPPRRR